MHLYESMILIDNVNNKIDAYQADFKLKFKNQIRIYDRGGMAHNWIYTDFNAMN
jgi:hypothetical protein